MDTVLYLLFLAGLGEPLIVGGILGEILVEAFEVSPPPRLVFTAKLPEGGGAAVQFSPDGRQILAACLETVEIWNFANEPPRMHFRLNRRLVVRATISNGFVAVADGDGQMDLVDTRNGKVLKSLRAEENFVRAMRFLHRESGLLTGGHEGVLKRWRIPELEMKEVNPRQTEIWSIALPVDESLIAVGTGDGQIVLWRSADSKMLRTWKATEGTVFGLSFSPDGKTLASCSQERTLFLWDVATGKERKRHELRWDINSVAYSPDGSLLAAGAGDPNLFWPDIPGKVALWDTVSGKLRKLFWAHESWVTSIAFSPSGEYLATAAHDGEIKVWSLKNYTGKAP